MPLEYIPNVALDQALELVHNPGACGHDGWHIVRTLLRFTVETGKISGVGSPSLVLAQDDKPPISTAPVEPRIVRTECLIKLGDWSVEI